MPYGIWLTCDHTFRPKTSQVTLRDSAIASGSRIIHDEYELARRKDGLLSRRRKHGFESRTGSDRAWRFVIEEFVPLVA